VSLSSGYPAIPGWPVVIGHGAALTSIVVTQVFARLQRVDRALEEASADLYANGWRTFRYVTLPTIRTAVLGAALLVFTLSLDEIAVTFFLIGRQNTLPLQIWGLLRRGITPEVNAAATLIFAVSLIIIVWWSRLMRDPHST
jgi:spermidine/putrescine transport system permease protein